MHIRGTFKTCEETRMCGNIDIPYVAGTPEKFRRMFSKHLSYH